MISNGKLSNNVTNITLNMKTEPEVYRNQRAQNEMDSVTFLEKYKDKIKWKPHGDRTIDLGSGEGGMTNILEKYLPLNYEKLVGCDLNPSMVKYARKHYGTDRVKFHQMDIQGDVPKEWRKGFDHVFSFFTLHWVKNQQKAFRNIFQLLDDDGDCFLLLVARHPLYDVFLILSKKQKWSPYLQNVHKFFSPYNYCQEPDVMISDMMKEIGFSQIDVRCKQMVAVNNLQTFINFLIALQPFDIPNKLMDEFRGDVGLALQGLGFLYGKDPDSGEETILYNYNLLVVYAAK